jgi:hypothetical protein
MGHRRLGRQRPTHPHSAGSAATGLAIHFEIDRYVDFWAGGFQNAAFTLPAGQPVRLPGIRLLGRVLFALQCAQLSAGLLFRSVRDYRATCESRMSVYTAELCRIARSGFPSPFQSPENKVPGPDRGRGKRSSSKPLRLFLRASVR